MEPHIIIDFENVEGAVRRILGVIEQRGFEIVSIELPAGSQAEASMTVGLNPRGEGRSPEILGRQLERLHSVARVQVRQTESFERECA